MKKEVLSQFVNPDLVLLSFLLFFACFIGVVIWATLKSNKKHFDKMSKMPLEGDDEKGGQNGK